MTSKQVAECPCEYSDVISKYHVTVNNEKHLACRKCLGLLGISFDQIDFGKVFSVWSDGKGWKLVVDPTKLDYGVYTLRVTRDA